MSADAIDMQGIEPKEPQNEPKEPQTSPLDEPSEVVERLKNDDKFVADIVDKATKKLEKKGRAGRKDAKKDNEILNENEDYSIFTIKNLIAIALIGIAYIFFNAYRKIEEKEKQENEN